MIQRKWLIAGAGILAVGGFFLLRGLWAADNSAAARGPAVRTVAVEVATASRKKVPVQVESLGNVTPIASVAIKPRIDSAIVGVHFQDGARVDRGQLLFTLDSRVIEAQVAQTEAMVARDNAQLAGAERDVSRYTDLVAKNATPTVNLDNAKTQADVFRAAIKSDEAQLDNLKVQLSYCKIVAPIAGRIGAAAVKVGNFVRQADLAPMATINQMAPVYVSFTVPQKVLPDIRKALGAETATVEAFVPGSGARENGQVTMIENAVDATTGMATVRATMPNKSEELWPGTLVTTDLTLRDEEAVVVPSTALQVSQAGNFVYIVKDNVAVTQPVKVSRAIGTETVIESGLTGGETIVTNGQLQLTNNARVTIRTPKAGS